MCFCVYFVCREKSLIWCRKMYAKRLHYDLIMLIDAYVKCFLAQFIWVYDSVCLSFSLCVCVYCPELTALLHTLFYPTHTHTSIQSHMQLFLRLLKWTRLKSASKQQFVCCLKLDRKLPNQMRYNQSSERAGVSKQKNRRHNVREHGNTHTQW